MSELHEIRNALTYQRFLADLLAKHQDQIVQAHAQNLFKVNARILSAVEAMEAKKQ